MDYIKRLPLAPHRCRSTPHRLPLATAVCIILHGSLKLHKVTVARCRQDLCAKLFAGSG